MNALPLPASPSSSSPPSSSPTGSSLARWWPWIAFVEGFASLAIEIIALRRLVPFMGSSITVTAPTIGLFLLALTAGYARGARMARADDDDALRRRGIAGQGGGDDAEAALVTRAVRVRIARNFLVAAALAGLGSSRPALQMLFDHLSMPAAYVAFMGLVVCPSAWLLAQTVPLIANVVASPSAGDASGRALTASTLGSFLGAVGMSLAVMPWLGVGAAVWLCAASLALGAVAAAWRLVSPLHVVASTLAVLGATAWLNLVRPALDVDASATRGTVALHSVADTAYAHYGTRVLPAASRRLPEGYREPVRVLDVNGQAASLLDASTPPRRAPYIERLQRLLVDGLGVRDARVLVLGAGGFTLALGDTHNAYTYVDIDPAIRTVAEQHFLRAPIVGTFVADDARRYVTHTAERYDAVVVDVFGAHAAVPAHLVTLEFWRTLPRVLRDDGGGGAIAINLILDGRLQSTYARNLLATIEAALGRCAVEVLEPARPRSNVIVLCRAARSAADAAATVSIYTDERNRAELDRSLFGD